MLSFPSCAFFRERLREDHLNTFYRRRPSLPMIALYPLEVFLTLEIAEKAPATARHAKQAADRE